MCGWPKGAYPKVIDMIVTMSDQETHEEAMMAEANLSSKRY